MPLLCSVACCFAGTFLLSLRVAWRQQNIRQSQRQQELLTRAMRLSA